MPTPSQKIPVDCPILGCRASTVHQHLPDLQYRNPRPSRAVHHHGYGSSDRDASSRPSLVVSLQIGGPGQGQGTAQLRSEAAEDETAAQGESIGEHEAVMSDDETAAQELLSEEQGQTWGYDAANYRSSLPSLQHVRDAGDRDPIIGEGASSLFQAPMTPPPSSPMAAEEGSSAPETPRSAEQPEEQGTAAPPALRVQFGDWLPGQGPKRNASSPSTPHVHTYDELIRPLVDPTLAPAPGMTEITRILQGCQSLTDPSYRPGVDEEDPDLPSLMMRPPITEYMQQFQEEPDEDFDMETYMWQ